MKFAWLTDVHLNFLYPEERKMFYQKDLKGKCDGVLITGDIAEAPSLIKILNEMADEFKSPIYFVLGNHDYYRGKIDEVHTAISALVKANKQLFWLPASGIQKLTNDTVLLGQDGWADGRFGDYENSQVSLNDSRLIADLFQSKILGKAQLLEKMQQLADIDAAQLEIDLICAIKENPKRIIVLTHVPPFKEACKHMGQISDENWLPYFSSKIMGDVLKEIAEKYPSIEFLVLCGHTHSAADYRVLDNLTVRAGDVEYSQPKVQEFIIV